MVDTQEGRSSRERPRCASQSAQHSMSVLIGSSMWEVKVDEAQRSR